MDNGERRGTGCQGTWVKDTWTKPKGVGSRVGGGCGWGHGDWWEKMETSVLKQQ